MTPSTAADIVHHLYSKPGDLLPFCGAVPGPDERTGTWNTGHERDDLLLCLEDGMLCCEACLSPAALDGWTPLIIDESLELDDMDTAEDQWRFED